MCYTASIHAYRIFYSEEHCGSIYVNFYLVIIQLERMGKGGKNAVAAPAAVDTKIIKNNQMRDDFIYDNGGEPHIKRHREIVAKYPKIIELEGNDPRPFPYVLMIIASQLTLAYYQQFWPFPVFFLVAWIYGGAASHALSLMTHEVSHNLIFKSQWMNTALGMLCNVAMGVPSSTMFKRYHMEHHYFQGDTLKDVDLPTEWEGKFFRSTLLKCVWLLFQPLFYALRPSVVNPKELHKLDIINAIFIISTDFTVLHFFGLRGLMYLVISTLLGMGFHPVAGHFVAEHYVFEEGHETYSYYGPLNLICWNVGYHNEHHDFPKVPGWRLPQVKAMAPEFYDNLPQHKSWTYVLYRFLVDPTINPFNRVKRIKKSE